MANSGQPEFFKQAIRLEPEAIEEMKRAAAAGSTQCLFGLSNIKEGIKVFAHPDYNHAVLLLRNPANIFKAIEALKSYVKDVEKYDSGIGQRRKVFELESFASFFEIVQNAKESESVEPIEEQIKEIKIEDWCPEWIKTRANSIINSKILIYLHMKTFEHLVSQNILAEEQMAQLLDKLNELASRSNLADSAKSAFKHLIDKSTLRHALKDAVDGKYNKSSDDINQFIGKVQSFPAITGSVAEPVQPQLANTAGQVPEKSQLRMDTSPAQRPPQVQDNSSPQTPQVPKAQDSNLDGRQLDNRMEESPVLEISFEEDAMSAGLEKTPTLSPTRQAAVQTQESPAKHPELQMELDPIEAEVQAARLRMETSIVGAKQKIEQKASFFGFGNVMHLKRLFGSSRFFTSLNGMEEISRKPVDFQALKSKIENSFQNRSYQELINNKEWAVKNLLPLGDVKFQALPPIDRLDLLVYLKEPILKRFGGGTWCSQDPLNCPKNCNGHVNTWNVFELLYDGLFANPNGTEHQTKPLSSLLKGVSLSKSATRQLIIERLLPFIMLHMDDLDDQLDDHLVELTAANEATKNEIWFIKAQITVMHLSKCIKLHRSDAKDRVLKFLENYLRFAGEYYLGGSQHPSYREEFLRCCAYVETLVDQKKFHKYTCNIGNNQQSIYGAFLDIVVADTSRHLSKYEEILENLIVGQAGSPSFKSEAIKKLKQDSGRKVTLFGFLEELSRKHGKPVKPELLDQWLLRLKVAAKHESSEALLIEDSSLSEAFEVLQFLQIHQETRESAQLLQDVCTLLHHKFQTTLKQPTTLAAIISRLEHKEHYFKFFSDAAKASTTFAAVFQESKLNTAFEELSLLQAKQSEINQMFSALEELRTLGKVEPLGKEIELFKQEMKDPSKLMTDRLLEIYKKICKCNKKVKSSAQLVKTEFYKYLLEQKHAKPNMPLDEYRILCEEIEDKLCQLLSGASNTMDKQQYLQLQKLLNDDHSVRKISEVLMLENDVKTAQTRFNFYRLISEFKQIEKGFEELCKIFKFINDSNDLLGALKGLHQKFLKDTKIDFAGDTDISDLLKVALGGSHRGKDTQQTEAFDEDADNEDHAQAVRIFCADIDLVCSIGNIKKLFDQFSSKENSHFNNLTFSRSLSATSLDKKQIDELEAFMGFMKKLKDDKKAKKIELHEWVRLISSKFKESKLKYYQKKFFLSNLLSQAELLIEVSQNLIKGVEKGPEEMNKILQKSRIVFNSSDRPHYTVFALTPNRDKREFLEEEHKLNPNLMNQVALRDLNSIKTQMAITHSNQAQLSKEGPADRSTTFIRLIDSVVSIKESLEGIAALGLVYDLDGQIKKEIESANSRGDARPSRPRGRKMSEDEDSESDDVQDDPQNDQDQHTSEDTDYNSIRANIVVNKFDLRIKLEASNSDAPNIAHFVALQKILSNILRTGRERMVQLGSQFHQITKLTGRQKLLLCQYFLADHSLTAMNGDQCSASDALKVTVDSLCMFSVGQIVPPLTETAKDAKSKSKAAPGKMHLTSDILEHVFSVNNINNQTSETPEVGAEDPEVDSVGQCLYYYPTEANNTVHDLLQILRYNQSQSKSGIRTTEKEHYSRFFLAKESSSAEELYQFIVRVAQDPSEVFYYMLDLHLLSAEVAQTFLRDLQEVFFSKKPKTCNYNLAMLIKSNSEGSLLLPEFEKNNSYRSLKLDMSRPESSMATAQGDLIQTLGVKIIESEQAGMGKSTFIAQTALDTNRQLITINLSGDISPAGTMRRVAIIKELSRKAKDNDLVLHIKLDMVENFEANSQIIDQFLFEVCYLKCLPYKDGYIFLDKVEQVFVEVQNTCKKAYYEKISFLRSVIACKACVMKIPKLKSLDDLKRNFKINYWTENDQQDCAKLCVMLKHLDKFTAFVPKNGADDSVSAFYEHHNTIQDASAVLADLLDQFVIQEGKKQYTELTFVLVRSWVRIVHYQLRSAHNLPSLNLFWRDKAQHPKMTALRLSIFQTLVQCSIKITWGAATHIRKQHEGVIEVVSGLKERPDSMNQLLQQYKDNVKDIPEWIDSKLVNYLPLNESLTVIYSSIKDVPPQMIKDLTELSGMKTNPLIDYDALENGSDIHFQNLCQSLLSEPDVAKMKAKASTFKEKGFRLTQEIFAKILMIYQQAELNVPIVIMGPSGCGKTYLVSFTADCLLGDHFSNLPLHPGVTEEALKQRLLDCYELAQSEIEAVKVANSEALEKGKADEEAWKVAMKEWESTRATNPEKLQPVEPNKPRFTKPKRVWLLFDEFNTSHLQCLVAEIMVVRSASFHKDLLGLVFPDNLVFVACCNPYKIEVPKLSQVGLANDTKSGMLAHRVYPVPDTLIGYVWKFGVIKDKDEIEHIRPDVNNINFAKQFKIFNQTLVKDIQANIIMTVTTCQRFFRKSGNENSVSLRDVGRFLKMFTFLMSHFQSVNLKLRQFEGSRDDQTPTDGFELYDALIVATQYCYILRLDTLQERQTLMKELVERVPKEQKYEERFIYVLDTFANEIKDKLNISLENAALNRPLKENLFASWMSLLTNIPLLICGKPGTSKTLSINIVEKAFNLDSSKKAEISSREPLKFFGKWPSVTFRNFWGTETTTSKSVEEAFEESQKAFLRGNPHIAAQFKQPTSLAAVPGASETQTETQTSGEEMNDTEVAPGPTVQTFLPQQQPEPTAAPVEKPVALVFDEIGLAEISKDNPLKVLHAWLDPEVDKFSFIGLSNWKLDASKMNRLLYVARPDMTTEELVATCESRTKSYQKLAKKLKPYFMALAESYVEFRALQIEAKEGHNNFHGSRDFYSAIAMFTRMLDSLKKVDDDEDSDASTVAKDFNEQDRYYLLMRFAIQRSFAGLAKSTYSKDTPDMLKLFEAKVRQMSGCSKWVEQPLPRFSQMEMIYYNLKDLQARHLMIFTASTGIEDIIVEKIRDFQLEQAKLEPRKFVYLSQKKGRDEMIRLIMTQLPVYTRGGYTVIMKDMEDVYGCMYDLLNKNYFKEEGKNRCRLFYEGHEDVVDVSDNFKIVLLMKEIKETTSQKDLEQQLPAPLLNRFEKYTLGKAEFMTRPQIEEYNKLTLMFDLADRKRFRLSPLGVVHNLSDELLLSVVMTSHGSDTSSLSQYSKGAFDSEQSVVMKVLVDQTNDSARTAKDGKKPNTSAGAAHGSVSDQSLRKLAPLFSRNMIIMKALCFPRSEYYDIEGEEFQHLFLETHPYDSLAELVLAMSQQGNQIESKFVLFTYTPYMQIHDVVKAIENTTTSRFDVKDASILHSRNADTQGEIIKKLVSDLSKTLVVYFKNRKDWRLMQHLRYSIRTTPGAEHKKVIFTAHYASQDISAGLKVSSPISYFSDQWRMVSIDDLSGSRYEQCFQTLEVPVNQILKEGIKVLTKGSKKEYLLRLARKALTDFIKTNDLLRTSFEKSNRVVELLLKRDALMQHLSQRLEETLSSVAPAEEELDEPDTHLALDLLRPSSGQSKAASKSKFDYLTAFDTGNDLFVTLGDRLTSYMSGKLDSILAEMAKYFPFEIIAKAALLVHSEQNEFLKHFEEVALGKKPFKLELYGRIKSIQFQGPTFRLKFKNHIEDMKVLVKDLYSGNKAGSRTQFDQRFATIISDTDGIKACFKSSAPDPDEIILNSESSLTALFAMEGLSKEKASCAEAIHSLLLQTTQAYLDRIKLADIAKEPCILTLGVILFSHIFQEELEVLSLYFSQFGMKKLETAISTFVRGFIENGIFDIAKCAESLFVIQNISSKPDVKSLVLQFETGIRLSKRLPRLLGSTNAKDEKSTVSREIFLSILNWIDQITDQAEFNIVRNIFNEAKKNLDSKKIKGYSSFCMQMLEGLLTQTKCNFSSVRLIVDSTLGDFFSMIDEKSPVAGLLLLASLLSERIIRDPDNSQITRPIVLLAKVIKIANLDTGKRDEVNRTVNEKITGSGLISNDIKERIIADINFQLVNSNQQMDSKISLAKNFLDNQLVIIRNMPNQNLSTKILENEQILSLQALKKLINSWKTGDANNDTQEKRALELQILKGLEKENSRDVYLSSLLLLQSVYVTINDVNKLKSIGLEHLSKKMVELMTDESKSVLLPNMDRYAAVKDHRKVVLQTPDPTSVPQDTFDKRFEMFNMVYIETYQGQERKALLDSLSATPRYQEFIRALIATSMPQQEENDMDLYHLLGIAANLVESARDSFVYSKTKLKSNFAPLINWENDADRLMLKLLHIKQTITYGFQVTDQGQTIWTKVYRCTDPTCRYMIPVGNCGKFGYHTGEENTKAKCPGTCGRVVGDYGKDSSKFLTEVTMPQMEAEIEQLLKSDDVPGSFKQEDASKSSSVNAITNFDEEWILRKYKAELKDRNSAAFVYLIQHIFALVWKIYSGPATIQLPPDGNTMHLLTRDIELLKHMLQKDHETAVMFLILFFDKMQHDVSDPAKPDLNSPSELRKYLSTELAELMTNFTTKLQDYNRLRSSVLGEATEQRLQVLNYVNGNHTMESMQLLYPELILPTIWLKPAQPFEERPIEEFLVQEKAKNNPQAAFVLDLLSKRNYLDKIRPILLSILKFASLLGKKFDKRFSREECLAFQDTPKKSERDMGEDDNDEEQETSATTYKLNLASILDNSYFRSSQPKAPQSPKPQTPNPKPLLFANSLQMQKMS